MLRHEPRDSTPLLRPKRPCELRASWSAAAATSPPRRSAWAASAGRRWPATFRCVLIGLCAAAALLPPICAARSGPAAGPAPAAEQLRFHFETGTLEGWQVVEGAFAKLLNDRDRFRNRRTKPFNKQGKFFLDTVEKGRDPQTGVVESPVFVLTGPDLSMLVGGGRHPDTYVALCTLDGKEVLRARGDQDEILQRRTWQAPQLVGKLVFLRIVDRHRGGWGHVTFDDFVADGHLDPAATRMRDANREVRLRRRRTRKALADLSTGPLRRAIVDLRDTFPRRYGRATEFLARLARLEERKEQLLGAISSADGDTDVQAEKWLEEFREFRRTALTANPLVGEHPILFVVRHQYRSDHHNTATLFQKGEINAAKFQGGGALKVLDVADGWSLRTILATPSGVARDPEVHFNGERLVFSLRRNRDDEYHIYEIRTDGTDLKQLTSAPGVSDIDPLYLADGDIAFSSTREPKYCMCNRHIMANLFRMEADGANILQIGKNTLFEGHGSLTPDGRILYDRWEYVDRNFGDAQGLWTVNPDGTNHALYWGNNTWSPGAVIDARTIPGTRRAICVFGSCHDLPRGALALIDRGLGLEGRRPVVRTWPADAAELVVEDGAAAGRSGYGFDLFKKVDPKYEDPYPLSDKYFLCSRTTRPDGTPAVFLIDVFGNEILLHSEEPGCFDPMPLGPRPRPPVIPARRDFDSRTGSFYIRDVYAGTHMQGVRRGTVKSLRVVESPEKRFWTYPGWSGQGTMAPAMNWHDFNNKRILGTVPVEEDGSAYFAVPAERFVFFQLLDEAGMMVQSMRSGTLVQPGERAGCMGCHDNRASAPAVSRRGTSLALLRGSSQLRDWYGPPRLFSYQAEVQPVFDRLCVRCHDFGKKPGAKLNLAGDRTETFCVSYNELWRKKRINVVGAGPSTILPPYSWGAHASRLIDVLRTQHEQVELDAESLDRLITWLDINAPYYPSYASAFPANLAGRCPLNSSELARLEQLTGIALGKRASHTANPGPQISFDRPELSPLLARFAGTDSAGYREALQLIRTGQARMAQRKRADMAEPDMCPTDRAREEKYRLRRRVELRNRSAAADGRRWRDGDDPAPHDSLPGTGDK